MRTFRGLRDYPKEWVYGYLIGDDVIVGNIIDFNDEYFNTSFWYKVDPKTVGQSTGLRDKNGKEMYEGDIITWYDVDYKRQIGWNDQCASFGLMDVRNGITYWDFDLADAHESEIIGNIHEHPELLEREGRT